MKRKRQSTVEPVFGTLTQFMGLRKINTLGIQQANKVMHLSAMAYNLKKYVKFTQKLARSEAKSLAFVFSETILFIKVFWSCVSPSKKQNSTLIF
ncbi:transposase [Flavobacteriaceae bacterium]|nr:transposase [Flavobacteriaceae bacterium]